MNRFCFTAISIILVTVFAIFLLSGSACAAVCERWIAKAVSVQGGVDTLRAGEKQWRPVKMNDTFCPGDMIRILKQSRADVVLSNNGILRLDQSTTVTFSEPDKEKTFLINLLEGAAYFFSRVRRSLRIFTPFVNAIGEGTEFLIRVGVDQALVSVFEGRVSLTNDAGSLMLARGQSSLTAEKAAPALHVLVRPRDAVQWTLYYPPVLDYRPSDFGGGPSAGWQAMVRRSMEFFRAGDLRMALVTVEEVKEEVRDPRFFCYRASLRLSVGRVDEAGSDIERVLQAAAGNADALALQAIIALAQNEKQRALELAGKAADADPKSAAGRIALSYALQADFDLRGALASLQEAVKLDPENGLTRARLAELQLSLGELTKALESASKAASLDPGLSRTQTVLGFAYLAQIKTKMAKAAFQRAIEIDQADPLPRLGLGLAMIRDGDLAEGRGEIEIAASLDPNNSLIRSYLGKAYYEEKRDALASDQLAMAKELDPRDPTAFFYDAIRMQSINRPVEALHDLQQSIALNDNRALYRSRFLLDSDLAARSASLARIYSDLGFQQLALVEGWKSVNIDPTNYSAHRFLADSYAVLPRHEIARVSELLQSQLLQPININPVQPHLAESGLFILNGAGPVDSSFNEFNPLFNRDRLAFQGSGIAGGQSTWGDEVVQSGVWGPLSYSIGQFHYQTDGFRANNDLKESIYNAFLQGSLSYKTSLQAEFRSADLEQGDRTLNFFGDYLPDERLRGQTRTIRLGFRHSFSPSSSVIGSFIYADVDSKVHLLSSGFPFDDRSDRDNYSAEVQHLFRWDRVSVVSGIGYAYVDDKTTTEVTVPPSIFSLFEKTKIHNTNLYLYSQINYPKTVTWTIGGSGDFLRGEIVDRNQFNPKFGVTWTPFPSTTLRAGVVRILTRTLVTNQTIEPTQVAGFNQFFDDAAGTDSWRYGGAIEQRFLKNLYAGVEYSRRNLNVPFERFAKPPGPPLSETVQVDWEERLGRAYLYWAPHPWLGLSVEYLYERFDRAKEFVGFINHVTTHRFPLGINFYHPSGFIAQLKATYIDQEGRFQPQHSSATSFLPGSDRFCLVDASVSYRLPKRYGLVTLGAKNLFDKSFKFQDTDPASPWIQPKRLVFGKFTLAF